MTQPQEGTFIDDSEEMVVRGAPRWYLSRLTQKLLARQGRYDRLEAYAIGRHPMPNADKRYVVALRELQRKCRTNYCYLVGAAVINRMEVIGFQFGPEQQVDEDAKKIWHYNDMDLQAPIIIKMAAMLGDTYGLVSPPLEDDGEPLMTAEDPRMCIVEPDPRRPSHSLCGMKMWQDEEAGFVYAALYLPDQVRLYEGPIISDIVSKDNQDLTQRLISHSAAAGGYRLIDIQDNPFGEVPLVRGNWQPAFGTQGRCEFEEVIDIQDRINHMVLDRLVIAKNQAFNQKWVTGARAGDQFRPGSDMVWATLNDEAHFGQFEAVDLTQILQATREDVGDLAAISQTPAGYLMNRMVNVSGDTLTQDQAALVVKVQLRMKAIGWMFEKMMRIAFAFKGDTAKAKETQVVTLWRNPEILNRTELGDSFSKFAAGGVPIDVNMKITGLWTDDQIESAKQQFEEQQKREQEMALEQSKQQGDNTLAATKQQGDNAVAAAKAKPKPSSGSGKK